MQLAEKTSAVVAFLEDNGDTSEAVVRELFDFDQDGDWSLVARFLQNAGVEFNWEGETDAKEWVLSLGGEELPH